MRNMATLYFDGGYKDGVGTCACVLDGVAYNSVIEKCKDNVEAEYLALIFGLKKAIALGISNLEIKGDSRVVLHQLTGQVKTRKTHSLHREAVGLLANFSWTVEWVPRSRNPAGTLLEES